MFQYQSTVMSAPAIAEGEIALLPNSPNPFIEMTLLWFRLPEDSDITLRILDSHGHIVHTRTGRYNKGENHLVLQRADIREPGIYMYRLETSYGSASRRLVMY